MKTFNLVLGLLLSSSVWAEYKEVQTFTTPYLNEISKALLDEMNGSEMGEVFSYKLEIKADDLPAEIESFLMDKYIDDIKVNETEEEDTDIVAAINNLNYYRLNVRSEYLRLENMMMMTEMFLGYENTAELYKLDSKGYGSFGEANGFALYIPEKNELFIMLSGYAE